MARVLIIGAGAGGLTTAIGIHRSGIEAIVLEEAPEIREIGSAISLWPNALKALAHFGIADTVHRLAIEEGSGCLRSWRGTILSQIDLRELGRNWEISPWYCGVQSYSRYCATPHSVRRYAWGRAV